jgi:hypothetical protein
MSAAAVAEGKQLYITLVGGGNSTHCFAPLACSQGHRVAILTRRPEDWSETVEVVNDDVDWLPITKMECKPELITSDPAKCIPHSDIIIIAGVPIHHNPALLRQMKPHLRTNKKVFIGSICAYGGFDWVAHRELQHCCDYSLFGTQLIPWCCGTLEYGKTGIIIGTKRMLRIATEDGTDPDGIKDLLRPILRQNLRDTDFLASTLWPNNPSLHPPILYGLFKDWDGKTSFDPSTLPVAIYGAMTDASAKVVCDLDDELVAITEGLKAKGWNNKDDFRFKKCVLENYLDQITDSTDTVSCIRTNKAFAKHKIPYQKVAGTNNVVPVIAHKFFETDLPFGLVTFKDIALLCGVPTPLIDDIILWNQKLIDKEYIAADGTLSGRDIDECIVPSRMGIDLSDLSKGMKPLKKQRTA